MPMPVQTKDMPMVTMTAGMLRTRISAPMAP